MLAVNKAPQLRHHTEVIHVNRVLINVLKDGEAAILERQLDAIIKVLVGVDDATLLVPFLECGTIYN